MEEVAKKNKKILKKIILAVCSFIVLVLLALTIYTINPYKALDAMDYSIERMDTSAITIVETSGAIKYTVENPSKNIIFVPGGLVKAESYSFFAALLATHGYNVTIVKPMFNLAILAPNQAARYTDMSMDNVIIGHSLGGVVASRVASKNVEITKVILLASYSTVDLTDKDVLVITAANDGILDQEAFEENKVNLSDNATFIDITGANHAQFGWYGPQKGDGEADLTTVQQETFVVNYIVTFLS